MQLSKDSNQRIRNNNQRMSKLTKREFGDESDDSEDEIVQSRIGEVPHQWYRKEEHFGYKADGKKLEKLDGISGKELNSKKPIFWTR